MTSYKRIWLNYYCIEFVDKAKTITTLQERNDFIKNDLIANQIYSYFKYLRKYRLKNMSSDYYIIFDNIKEAIKYNQGITTNDFSSYNICSCLAHCIDELAEYNK